MTGTTEAWAVPDYGPVESLQLMPRAIADPGPVELVIDVEAMALNPLDLKIMSGAMKDMMPAAMPYTPGSDMVGHVVAAGLDAAFRIGDRVLASSWNGALARRALLPASAHVVACPDDRSAGELAALPMAGLTALHILRMLGEMAGQTLAILGATGGVGLMLAQLAQQGGARVVASGTAADAALLRDNGADIVLDYHAQTFADGVAAAVPGGVDAFVDLVSMFDALHASAVAVRDGGRLLSTLFGPEPAAFGDRIAMSYVRLHADPGDLARVRDGYLAGALRANVMRTFDFADGRAACLALRDDHVTGKIVVTMA